MTLKVITNTTNFALFDELDAGEEYIVFGDNNKVYDYHLDYGDPDFGFWKKVCREENVNIDDLVLDELDEESITTEQMSAVYERFGRIDDDDLDEFEKSLEGLKNGFADYLIDQEKDRRMDLDHNIGDHLRDYMIDAQSKRN